MDDVTLVVTVNTGEATGTFQVTGRTISAAFERIPLAAAERGLSLLNLGNPVTYTVRYKGGVMYDRCTATLHHGPGHQSRTRCEVTGEHEWHRAHYDGGQLAEWQDGSYIEELAASGIPAPDWVNEGTAMTGFFDEPPKERS